MNKEHSISISMPWQLSFSMRPLRVLLFIVALMGGLLIPLRVTNALPVQDEPAAMKIAQTASAAQNGEDYGFAAEQWETLIEKYPTSKLIGKAHYNAGVCYLKLEQPTQAIPQFQASLQKLTDAETTKKPLAMLYLGFTQFQAGQKLAGDSQSKESVQLLSDAVKTFSDLLKETPKFENADQAFSFKATLSKPSGNARRRLRLTPKS